VKNLHTCERSQVFMKRMLKPGVKPELVWTRLVRGSSTAYGTRWYYAMYLIKRLELKSKRPCQMCIDRAKDKDFVRAWGQAHLDRQVKLCMDEYYKNPKLLAKDYPWSVVKPVLLKQLKKENL
jgi:hypothetical protein